MATGDRQTLEPRLRATLMAVAPGTDLREGLERILSGRTGALIVLGHDKTVESLCTGGFSLDIEFSATGLRELAKMDGAIVCDREARRIMRAGVHLMPDATIATAETGTRHRTADRVARQTGLPVISVSQSMNIIALYVGDTRYVLENTGAILSHANQALATLERYKLRLDEVSDTLSALEIEDLVTVRDVASVVQRLEMVLRISNEINDYVLELGNDGRLLALQLDELVAGVDSERELVIRDYMPSGRRARRGEHHSGGGRRALGHRPARHRDRRRTSRARWPRGPRQRGEPTGLPAAGQGAPAARGRGGASRRPLRQLAEAAGREHRQPADSRWGRRHPCPLGPGGPVQARRVEHPRALRLTSAVRSAGDVEIPLVHVRADQRSLDPVPSRVRDGPWGDTPLYRPPTVPGPSVRRGRVGSDHDLLGRQQVRAVVARPQDVGARRDAKDHGGRRDPQCADRAIQGGQ